MRYDWTYEELVLAADLVAANGFVGLRAHETPVIELSNLLRTANIHPRDGRPDAFRSPSSVQRKTFDISTRHPDYQGKPTRGGARDARVLQEFLEDPLSMHVRATEIRADLAASVNQAVPEDPDFTEMAAHEGAQFAAQHLERERSVQLRHAKIAEAHAAGEPVQCVVCDFSFERRYGELGAEYIEVHHVLPLHASGPRTTKLADLALLCSNCHRMIHRARPWLTPDELKARLLYHEPFILPRPS